MQVIEIIGLYKWHELCNNPGAMNLARLSAPAERFSIIARMPQAAQPTQEPLNAHCPTTHPDQGHSAAAGNRRRSPDPALLPADARRIPAGTPAVQPGAPGQRRPATR